MTTAGDPNLVGLFFVEFDTHYGRTLAYQEPRGVLSSDDFDALSDYLIPKPALCGQLIVIREPERTVLCWPMCIEDAKYDRNALLFSLGFIVHPPGAAAEAATAPADGASPSAAPASTYDGVCERYGPVLRKACGVLAALERETELLSDASRKGELAHLLPQVLHGLREHGRCAVAADAANTIHLRLPPRRPSAGEVGPPVEAHSCPVLLSLPPAGEVRRWDLTLQRLLRWIDGTRHSVDIARAARVDLALVMQALQALQSSGWLRLIDRFDLSNCYACMPALRRLVNDATARDAIVAAVARPSPAAAEAGDPGEASAAAAFSKPCTWPDVLRLYAAFQPAPDGSGWRSVRDVCRLYPDPASRVDVRALVQAGLLNKLIRRLHEEPMCPSLPPPPVDANETAAVEGAAAEGTEEEAPPPAVAVAAVAPAQEPPAEGGGVLAPGAPRVAASRPSSRLSKLRAMLEGTSVREGAPAGPGASAADGSNGTSSAPTRCTLDRICATFNLSPEEAKLAVSEVWPGCVWIMR